MKVKIIGYGLSGKAAESFLTSRDIETVVIPDTSEDVPGEYDFCVVSPGIPTNALRDVKIPVIPEVELPFYVDRHLMPNCLIAVTGTNGKTTIVNQIYQMCKSAGKRAVLCGNVGVPVSRVAEQLPGSIAVVEVSSFMLEQTKMLRPHIAVLTNITADHLDRHQTMEEYIRCKQQIVAHQKRGDILIVNWDDPNARAVGQAVARQHRSKVIWYSTRERVAGYYINRGTVYEHHLWGDQKLCAATDLKGMPHTVSNTLAVLAVGRRLRLDMATILKACQYHEQPHRVQLVADYQGVAFYNDSKATNIAATLAATRAFALPICLILCGLTKGQDYHELFAGLPVNVRDIIVFGACQNQVLAAAEDAEFVGIHLANDLTAAVQRAMSLTSRPGVILFSPGGSSFDQFRNYQERGDKFCEVVRTLWYQVPPRSHQVDVNL